MRKVIRIVCIPYTIITFYRITEKDNDILLNDMKLKASGDSGFRNEIYFMESGLLHRCFGDEMFWLKHHVVNAFRAENDSDRLYVNGR